MSLAFLSPSRAAEGTIVSPLRRALEGAVERDTVPDALDREEHAFEAESGGSPLVRDLSLDGIVEIRGDVDSIAPAAGEELLRLSPRRGFLFTDGDPVDAVERVRAAGARAYDATGAYAGLAISSEQAMRRLTDLDLDAIPTAGPFARVSALFRRDADGWYRVYVHQELGHYVAEAVLDALAGLQEQAWH